MTGDATHTLQASNILVVALTGAGISLDTAAIMSLVVTGILYGFSVLMFIGTIWTFTYNQRIRDVNRPIAAVATLMFLLSTAHMVVVIIRTEDGLMEYRDTFPGGPAAFFADVSQEMFVILLILDGGHLTLMKREHDDLMHYTYPQYLSTRYRRRRVVLRLPCAPRMYFCAEVSLGHSLHSSTVRRR